MINSSSFTAPELVILKCLVKNFFFPLNTIYLQTTNRIFRTCSKPVVLLYTAHDLLFLRCLRSILQKWQNNVGIFVVLKPWLFQTLETPTGFKRFSPNSSQHTTHSFCNFAWWVVIVVLLLFFLTHSVCNIFWCQTILFRWITRSHGHAPLHVVPAHSLHSTGGTWWLFLSHLQTSFCSLSTRWRTSAWAGKKHVCLLVFIYFLPRCTCALLVLYPPPAFGSFFVFLFSSYIIAPHGETSGHAQCSCGGCTIQDMKQTWHLLSVQGRCLFNEPSSLSSPNQHSLWLSCSVRHFLCPLFMSVPSQQPRLYYCEWSVVCFS